MSNRFFSASMANHPEINRLRARVAQLEQEVDRLHSDNAYLVYKCKSNKIGVIEKQMFNCLPWYKKAFFHFK